VHRQLVDPRVPNVVRGKDRTVANHGRLSGRNARKRGQCKEINEMLQKILLPRPSGDKNYGTNKVKPPQEAFA
jgi:hypothetical protein